MTGGYIRTNWRRQNLLGMDGIGGAVPKSSQTTMAKTAGAGTKDGYGGFIWLSWTGALVEATNLIDAGTSSRWLDSTYGLMQSYYGNGNFDSGYAFLPVVAYITSVSGVNFTHNAPNDSILSPYCLCFRHSGSYAIFKPIMANMIGDASKYSFNSLSGAAIDLQVGGFIVSTP